MYIYTGTMTLYSVLYKQQIKKGGGGEQRREKSDG